MMPRDRNSHHGLWERYNYKDGGHLQEARRRIIYRDFKVISHIALHEAIDAPPVLTVGEAADLIDYFDENNPQRGIESFEAAEEHFAVSAIKSHREQQQKMFELAHNFARQLVFIKGDYNGK